MVLQLDLCMPGFCIWEFSQLQIENIQEKCYVVVNVYYVARHKMFVSALNMYRFFPVIIP